MSMPIVDWSELSIQVMITFGHFLWQACVVALSLLLLEQLSSIAFQSTAIPRMMTTGSSKKMSIGTSPIDMPANLRYLLACIAFLALPVCVVATFRSVHQSRGTVLVANNPPVESPTVPVEPQIAPAAVRSVDGLPEVSPPTTSIEITKTQAEPIATLPVPRHAQTWFEPISVCAPYFLIVYLVGAGLMLARFGLSIAGSSRLCRTLHPIADSCVLKIIAEQSSKLGLSRIPVVSLCRRVSAPVVVGLFKPTILLPPALLCGLDPSQLAAILCHEMAHIRRYDLLINLVQRIVEALLFFHPATWWISHRVSVEREICCDEIAASCNGRLHYASALLHMAELCIAGDRKRMGVLSHMAADGGNASSFGYRIRRLIGEEKKGSVSISQRGLLTGLVLVSFALGSLLAWGESHRSNEETSDDGLLSNVFTPAPNWQIKISADEVGSEFSRVSPIAVAGNRIMTRSQDWDLTTGERIQKSFERLPRRNEVGMTLEPILRRNSSNREFIVEVSQRIPPATTDDGSTVFTRPSFDLRVLRTKDGSQVGATILSAGLFDPFSCDVDVSSDGNFVLIGSGESVVVYRTETGLAETQLPIRTKRIDAVAFSPEKNWIVASDQNDLHFWRWREQGPAKTIHAGRKIDSLVFTPDGQYLAEGPDTQADIQIREMRTLEIVASLRDEVGSSLMVSSMDISPDGRHLVAHNEVSVDASILTIPHRIHVWNLNSRKPVFQIATGEWVRKVAFSDDGRSIVGEFMGAAHGALLAAWNLPESVLSEQAESKSDANNRLGDGIQWSTWGDMNGLLSGARIVGQGNPLKAGEPLLVEYRLANVSTKPKSLQCYLNNGMQFPSIGSGNILSGFGLDRQREPLTLTLDPGEVFIDEAHRVSIDTTGLEPGKYQVTLGSAFFYPDESTPNQTHEIPHRGKIPFELVGPKTSQPTKPPENQIHWGEAIAGLRLGAQYELRTGNFEIGSNVVADLYVANVADAPIECSVVLPHPGDGWLFNVEENNGRTIMLTRQIPIDFWSPQRYLFLNLAPGQVARITGDDLLASYESSDPKKAYKTSQPKASFQIVGTDEEANQPWETAEPRSRLVSQGGKYATIFSVAMVRPDIPGLRIELDSSAPFAVIANGGNALTVSEAKQDVLQPAKTFSGHVEGDLAGVEVTARFELEQKPGNDSVGPTHRLVHTASAKTDARGNYSIEVPREYAGDAALTVHLRFALAGYLPRTIDRIHVVKLVSTNPNQDDSSHQDSRAMNELVQHMTLKKARILKGRVLLPNNSPAVGATVVTNSKYVPYSWKFPRARFDYQASSVTKTDANGNFELQTDQSATLVVQLAGYAPLIVDDLYGTTLVEASEIENDRIDFQLPKSIQASGVVRTYDGKPMGGAILSIQRSFKYDEFHMLLSFGTSVAADEQGRFKLPPLPEDRYKVSVIARLEDVSQVAKYNQISSERLSLSMHAVLHDEWGNFQPQKPLPKNVLIENVVPDQEWQLSPTDPTPQFEIKSVESVEIPVRIIDQTGSKQADRIDATIHGTFEGRPWYGVSRTAGDDGIVRLSAPKGVSNLEIGTGHAFHRLGPNAPIELGNAIQLGTIDKTITGLEIIRPQFGIMKVHLKLPPDMFEAANFGKEPIHVQSFYVREGYGENSSGKAQIPLALSTQTGVTEYKALALPNEEIVLKITKGDASNPIELHEERLSIHPGEVLERTIDLTKLVVIDPNHPLHELCNELKSKLNSNVTENPWRIVELNTSVAMNQGRIQSSGTYSTSLIQQALIHFDASKGTSYRLLLAREYRELMNATQQQATRPTVPKDDLNSEQIELVLFSYGPQKAPAELKYSIEWSATESKWPMYQLCLGDGLGFTWFINAPLQIAAELQDNLKLKGGDDIVAALVQATISKKDIPPAADVQTASATLSKYGDRAVEKIDEAVRRKKADEVLWYAILSLADIPTHASTKLLMQLYESQDSEIRNAAIYASIHQPYRQEAASVYLDLLKNRKSVQGACAACIELGLKDAIPVLRELFANHSKPSTISELNTIFAALRSLEGNPIPQDLLDAAKIIYQSHKEVASNETKSDPSFELNKAIELFKNSPDHEAVVLMAMQMALYTTKGNVEHIHAQGIAILRSQESFAAKSFLKKVLESLPESERAEIVPRL